MSVAGVRLVGGRMVWIDAVEFVLQPLDAVVVEIQGREHRGRVMVVPDALVRPTKTVGRLVGVFARETGEAGCSELPGADMPPLGTRVASGTVVAVDAVNRTITVEARDGTRSVISYRIGR